LKNFYSHIFPVIFFFLISVPITLAARLENGDVEFEFKTTETFAGAVLKVLLSPGKSILIE
jgi:hypothetical protein